MTAKKEMLLSLKRVRKKIQGTAASPPPQGKLWSKNHHRSYCQSFEGDWEQLTPIYDGQIMLDQLDCFLWWNDGLPGQKESSECYLAYRKAFEIVSQSFTLKEFPSRQITEIWARRLDYKVSEKLAGLCESKIGSQYSEVQQTDG